MLIVFDSTVNKFESKKHSTEEKKVVGVLKD